MDGMESRGREEKMVATARRMRCSELVLRLMALALTLIAAVILGVHKHTAVVPITLVSTLPPLNVPVTAKWHYMSAFVYFVVSNAIACSYAALSLLHSHANNGGKPAMGLIITILDLIMVALLFSGNGAAAAVGVVGYQGNSHVRWNKVCNVFDKFCHHVGVALVISLLGALAFILLVVLSALSLHKRSK